MKLTTSNVVTGNISLNRLSVSNVALISSDIQSLTIGNVAFTPDSVTVGSVSITPSAFSTPTLIVGGISYSGNTWGGIVNYQEFTANGTWYNPYANAFANAALTGDEQVFMMMWGGGGGPRSNLNGGGGGGGACAIASARLSSFTNTCSVTVGVGGPNNTNGGNSIFVVNASCTFTAYGGGGSSGDAGGGGGGALGAGSLQSGAGSPVAGAAGGGPLGGIAGNTTAFAGGDSTFGGGGGAGRPASGNGTAGISVFGGGGGNAKDTGGVGGNSIFGGGGGSTTGAVRSISVFGGNGGNNSVAPAAPGGGGTAHDGARGEVRVWVMGPAGSVFGPAEYLLTANTTTFYEGDTIRYSVSTNNVLNNTTLYYTLNNSSTATSSDFTSAVNGSIIVSSNSASFDLIANTISTTTDRTVQIDLRTTSSSGPIVNSVSATYAKPRLKYLSDSVVEISGGTIVGAPSGTQTGDLILVLSMATANSGSGSTAPTSVEPPGTGWTLVANSAGCISIFGINYCTRGTIYCKKAEAADLSATYTAMTGDTASRLRLVTYRPRSDLTISSISNGAVSFEHTNGNPAQQTINMSGAATGDAMLGICVFSSGTFQATSFTKTFTTNFGSVKSIGPERQEYRIVMQDRNYSNVTVDMTDAGNGNWLLSQFIKVSF